MKLIKYLEQVKGPLIKPCPGAKNHYCCNLVVVSQVLNCPYNCSYCFLHAFFGKDEIVIVRDEEAIVAQVKDYLAKAGEPLRVCTGEYSDSLAIPEAVSLGKKLVSLFAGQTDHLLELKTKSANIEKLLSLEHNGRAVVSWSVNPEKIVAREELGTPSLAERLEAARQVVAAGYPVAFHFDPIIHYEGWENDYREVVGQIFGAVKEKDIAWISLGTLRYQQKMKGIVERKFPHSKITSGEQEIGEDNKYRYLQPVREEMFRKMAGYIRRQSALVYLYLCMESPEVWQNVQLGNRPDNPYAKFFRFSMKGSSGGF